MYDERLMELIELFEELPLGLDPFYCCLGFLFYLSENL